MKSIQFHFPASTLISQSEPWFEFIHNETLRAGIYSLKAGEPDLQQPHSEDEIYYVLEGSARMSIGNETITASAGDVILVPAYVEHRFFDIREDLRLLVFFSKMPVK